MSEGTRPVEEMSEAEARDFVEEMHAAVYEELGLHEVAGGTTDMLPSGKVVHGPWQASACSRVLSRWHQDGLLSVYRYESDGSNGPDLPEAEAAALLADPHQWSPPASWSDVVALRVTEAGQGLPLDEWAKRVSTP